MDLFLFRFAVAPIAHPLVRSLLVGGPCVTFLRL